jgi:hypothetical protein
MDIRVPPATQATPVKLVLLATSATPAISAPLDKLAPLAKKANKATLVPLDIRVSLDLTEPTVFSELQAKRDRQAKRAALDTKATRVLLESWAPTVKTAFLEQLVIMVSVVTPVRRVILALQVPREPSAIRVIRAIAATLDPPAHKVLWDKTDILGSTVPRVTRVTLAQLDNKALQATTGLQGLSAILVRKVQLETMGL